MGSGKTFPVTPTKTPMHKKIMAVLAVLSCLLLPKVRANDIEPTKENYTAIHRGAAPIVVDGRLNEWTGVPVLSDPKFSIPKGSGSGGTLVLFEQYAGGIWSGPDDQTSAVEVVWDADNIYFGFIVTDDYHENAANSAWNGDSVQLMIANATRSGQVALYNYALGGIEEALNDPDTETIVNHEARPAGGADTVAIVRRDVAAKKTYYEIQLPASAVGLTAPITAGMKFGLGMAINDGDNGDGQAGQKGWGGLGAHAIVFGKTPSETALVTLSAETPGADIIFLSAINPQIARFTFRASDKGASIVNASSATLRINGNLVTLVPSAKQGDATDFTYTPAAPFAPGSVNTYAIEVKDASGNAVRDSGSFTTPQYALLSAADRVTPDTGKRGFIWTVHQNEGFTGNTVERAMAQLAGRLGPNTADPNAVGTSALAPATVPADPNAPFVFEIPGVINMNIDLASPQGNDLNDEQMVGVPGLSGSLPNDGIAADIMTFVELSAGLHTLIVNSDDGFLTTLGNVNDVFDRTFGGLFNAGRGAADTAFVVYAPEAGVYALRTIYEQGGGGANIELLEQLGDGTKVLLNSEAAGAPKTYRAATGGALSATSITAVNPGINQRNVAQNTSISATIVEGTQAVDLNSVKLSLNGTQVAATPTKVGNVITISFTPASALDGGIKYSASLAFTAGGTARVENWDFWTTIFGPTTIFIEAEDFNFEHGKIVTDAEIGMNGPYAGGSYQDKGDGLTGAACDGSDFGIDYNDNNSGSDQAVYRPNTPVEAGKRNGPAGLNRGYFNVEVNHVIGWTDATEWMNYTRTFPVQKNYKVYARMAHGDSNARRGGILHRVTSDPTVCNQTTTELGRFSAPWTGGWDNWPETGGPDDAIIQMTDLAGSPTFVKIGGQTTLRFQYAEGSGDFDFLAFVPTSEGIPPAITSLTPSIGSTGLGQNVPFAATIEKRDLDVSNATLKLDGADVPAVFTKTATGGTLTYNPPTPFEAGSSHTYTIAVADNAPVPKTVTTSVAFTVSWHPFPANTKFIEAEDFNFGHGNYEKTLQIGMNGVYDGGAYQDKGDGLGGAACDGSDFGIDYNDNNSSSDQAVYRPNTPVEAGKRNGPAGLSRQAFNVKVNHVIGWTGGDEWMNYTRDFGAEKTYKVMSRMAHGDGNARRGGILMKVTSDPTQCDQTTEELGRFSGAWTGGWDTWPDANTDQDALMMMKDGAGNDALIKLGGIVTLRYQYAEGSGDFDYLAFLPQAGGLPVKVVSVKPSNGATGVPVTGGAFEVVLEDQDSSVTGTPTLTLDGAAVAANVSKVGRVTTVRFTPTAAFAAGSQHTYVLSYVDSDRGAQTVTTGFRATYVAFPAGTLFIEAEDFNFEHGKTVTDAPIGMTGAYAGGSYQGKGNGLNGAACDGSDFGIDYNDNNSGSDQAVYRPNTPVEAGKLNGPAGFSRGTFDVSVNHVIGWTDGSEWMNYTRTFPAAAQYKVYSRMAHGDGGAGIQRGGILMKVTSDPTVCDQTTEELGRFAGPWTGGWDTFPDAGTPQDALMPMKDNAGNDVVVTLGGLTTLRYQYANNAGDFDYLAFIPVGTPPQDARFTSIVRNANGSITLTWEPANGFTLESTTALGPGAVWTPVAGATSPFTFTPSAPALYGRLKKN